MQPSLRSPRQCGRLRSSMILHERGCNRDVPELLLLVFFFLLLLLLLVLLLHDSAALGRSRGTGLHCTALCHYGSVVCLDSSSGLCVFMTCCACAVVQSQSQSQSRSSSRSAASSLPISKSPTSNLLHPHHIPSTSLANHRARECVFLRCYHQYEYLPSRVVVFGIL